MRANGSPNREYRFRNHSYNYFSRSLDHSSQWRHYAEISRTSIGRTLGVGDHYSVHYHDIPPKRILPQTSFEVQMVTKSSSLFALPLLQTAEIILDIHLRKLQVIVHRSQIYGQLFASCRWNRKGTQRRKYLTESRCMRQTWRLW
jgi:hypothetical protein